VWEDSDAAHRLVNRNSRPRKETLLSEDRDYTDYTDHVDKKDEGDDVEAHAAAAARFNDPDEKVDAAEEPPDVEGHVHHPKVD
jgi:hypothetical protein